MKNVEVEKSAHSFGSSGLARPSRRSFFDYLLGTSVVATLGAILYPIFKFMSPPQVIESTETSVVAAKISEVPINSGKIFKFGSKPGIIIRTASGELKACSAVCTHLDCIVQYRPDFKHIWCACHNGHYNVDGANISGPPPRPLEQYTVNTRGDEIVVSKS
ncbi:MAG TPA: ubiquinol-cytochrome c reductase iron-sulfur subunit [Pyrinomonadaceae bacterium]|jgi:Rieske Fe-S protein|nr:ubiquinol-cytochrome c reductase iron-sulfur subunit [Pyrinomonadaceae bacterium]